MLAAWNSGFDVDEIAMLDISGGKIALAGEQYIASTEDTAVAIVKAINGCVVLVMTSYCGKFQYIRSV